MLDNLKILAADLRDFVDGLHQEQLQQAQRNIDKASPYDDAMQHGLKQAKASIQANIDHQLYTGACSRMQQEAITRLTGNPDVIAARPVTMRHPGGSPWHELVVVEARGAAGKPEFYLLDPSVKQFSPPTDEIFRNQHSGAISNGIGVKEDLPGYKLAANSTTSEWHAALVNDGVIPLTPKVARQYLSAFNDAAAHDASLAMITRMGVTPESAVAAFGQPTHTSPQTPVESALPEAREGAAHPTAEAGTSAPSPSMMKTRPQLQQAQHVGLSPAPRSNGAQTPYQFVDAAGNERSENFHRYTRDGGALTALHDSTSAVLNRYVSQAEYDNTVKKFQGLPPDLQDKVKAVAQYEGVRNSRKPGEVPARTPYDALTPGDQKLLNERGLSLTTTNSDILTDRFNRGSALRNEPVYSVMGQPVPERAMTVGNISSIQGASPETIRKFKYQQELVAGEARAQPRLMGGAPATRDNVTRMGGFAGDNRAGARRMTRNGRLDHGAPLPREAQARLDALRAKNAASAQASTDAPNARTTSPQNQTPAQPNQPQTPPTSGSTNAPPPSQNTPPQTQVPNGHAPEPPPHVEAPPPPSGEMPPSSAMRGALGHSMTVAGAVPVAIDMARDLHHGRVAHAVRTGGAFALVSAGAAVLTKTPLARSVPVLGGAFGAYNGVQQARQEFGSGHSIRGTLDSIKAAAYGGAAIGGVVTIGAAAGIVSAPVAVVAGAITVGAMTVGGAIDVGEGLYDGANAMWNWANKPGHQAPAARQASAVPSRAVANPRAAMRAQQAGNTGTQQRTPPVAARAADDFSRLQSRQPHGALRAAVPVPGKPAVAPASHQQAPGTRQRAATLHV